MSQSHFSYQRLKESLNQRLKESNNLGFLYKFHIYVVYLTIDDAIVM